MIRRHLFVLFCVLLTATACSTSQTADDAEPTAAETIPERTLPYPKATRAVLRVRLDKVPALVDGALEIRDAARGTSADDDGNTDGETDDANDVSLEDRAGTLLARTMLTDHFEGQMAHRLLVERAELPDDLRERMITNIDTDRPVLAAFSTRHDEKLFRQLRYGAPGTDLADMPRSPSLRLFFPAENEPDALVSQLESACGDEPCDKIVRTATHDSWAVVDVHYDPLGSLREKRIPETIPESWEGSEDYFRRLTPAARAFLTADTAVAAYGRTEDISAFGALTGAWETSKALEHASPENRRRLALKGYFLSGHVYGFEDPTAREHEDVAVRVGRSGAEGWTMESYTTRTERGRAIADKSTFDGQLPAIRNDGAALRLEFASPPGGALDEAAIPERFQQAIDHQNFGALADELRSSGVWPYYQMMTSYPIGTLKAIEDSWDQFWARQLPMSRPPWRQLHAFRAAIGVEKSDASPVGLAPTGGIAALVDADSRLPNLANRFAGMAGQMTGVSIGVDTQAREESGRTLITVAFGDSENLFGDATGVDVGLAGRLEAEHLAAAADKIPRRRRRGQPPMQALWRVAQSLGSARLETTAGTGAAAAYRLHLGDKEPADLAMPDTRAEPAAPEPRPACARRAADISRDTLGSLEDTGNDHRSTIDEALEKLASAEETCRDESPSDADDIHWVRGRWLQHRATLEARAGLFDTAAETMTTACERLRDADCPAADTLRGFADNYRAPTGTVHRRLDTPPGGLFFLGRTSPFLPDTGGVSENRRFDDDLRTAALTDGPSDATAEARQTVVDRLPIEGFSHADGEPAAVGILGVDRTVGSDTLEALLGTMNGREIDRRTMYDLKRTLRTRPPSTLTGLALHVRPGDEANGGSGFPVLVLRTAGAPVDSQAPRFTVTVRSDGLTVARSDGSTLAENTDVDQLPDALPELDKTTSPPVFDLAIPDPVSTGRLTRVAGALTAYARTTHGDDAIPHIRLAD